MKDFLPEVVQFSIPFIFVLLITALAVVFSYTIYRQTNPDNSFYVRIFLATLRTILLIILILLFFKPKVIIQFFEIRQKNIALLVDHSASMSWEDEGEKRIDSVKTAIKRIEDLFTENNVKWYRTYFNKTILQQTDSLDFPFGTTNFKKAFDYLVSSNFEMAVLVSDGIRTEGVLPQMSQIPVYTVGLGKISSFPDAFITDVEYNPVVYQDKEQTITVKISSNNLKESSAKLFVYRGNKLLINKNIFITKSGLEQEIKFKFKVQQTGLQRFKVEIKTDTDDSNTQNNTFVYAQEVLKNRIRLGIFSSVPNNDHKFLKFLISKSENIEVYSYLKIKNRPIENYPIDSLDVMVLQGYPGKQTSAMEIDRIAKSIRKNGQGLIFFLDDYTDIKKLRFFGMDHISKQIAKRDRPLFVTISPVIFNSLLLRLYDIPERNYLFFNSVPPIASTFKINNLENDVQILINSSSGAVKDKSILVSEVRDQKIIVFNGSGFWRWHFSLQKDEKLKDGYLNLLTNIIRWVVNKNKFKAVVLNINEKTVNPGQEILFAGRLFDSQNNPIINGQILINAQSAEQSFTIPMQADSSGGFSARYTPVNEGTYSFDAQGITDGKIIGNDKKSIVVVPYKREFIRTNQDSSFLKLLSENSGAEYYNLKSLDSLQNHLSVNNKEVIIKEELELRFKSWLLYFLILVAVTEWIFRKKNNLP